MSEEATNPVYDTVIRFTVKQGTEYERCPSTIDDNKKRPTNTTTVGAKDFDAYYYFPSGELIYTRDTGRLFIGNNTYPAITAGSISESGIKNQITPGGVLVGNKYLGSFSDSAFDEKWFKFSEYNSNIDAYNGDYRFDASSSILYLYDTNVVAPTLDIKALSEVHSKDSQKISSLLNSLDENGTRNFIPFFNFIPDGRTLDIDAEGNTFTSGNYEFKILKVVNIDSKPVHQWFDHSTNKDTTNNKVTTDFFVDGKGKLKLRLDETILKNLYKRTAVGETEKDRIVITDANGNLYIYPTISTLELNKLNGLANYRRYDLNNNKSMSYIALQHHIGQPFYVNYTNTTVNKGKYNEETYRTTYIKGSHIARDEKMSSKWNTAYSTLWSNIGAPEWTDGTNRGSIWSNIGNSPNYVGDTGHSGRNTATNQAPTSGLAHFDHNINSSGKAQGNVIDIWYNIGDPLAYANIWKYENGKRTNTKQISGNVVPASGYSSGYRYQSLWECIGARQKSATDAKHYNLWNHIGDKTSYTTKLQTISWPSSPSSNPIPTIGTKADSLSTLKTTVWGGIENLRSQINALYSGLKNACTYIKGYVDSKVNSLYKYIDDTIKTFEESLLSKLSFLVGSPQWGAYTDYMIDGSFTKANGFIDGEENESITITIINTGWLFCAGNGGDGSSGTGLLIQYKTGENNWSNIFDIIAYDYGHPYMLIPVRKNQTYKISCPNNVRLKTVRVYRDMSSLT